MSENSLSSGTMIAMPGHIDIEMMIAATSVLNLNSMRAIVYAANVPMISVSAVVTPATTRLLPSERQKPTSLLNTPLKLAKDTGLGKNELEPWSLGRRRAEATIQ